MASVGFQVILTGRHTEKLHVDGSARLQLVHLVADQNAKYTGWIQGWVAFKGQLLMPVSCLPSPTS